MLNFAIDVFEKSKTNTLKASQSSVPVSKLLVILSDGRGIFYEGIERVKNSIQYAIQHDIFTVFVILDTPGKSSIFDIKMPIFMDGNPVKKFNFKFIVIFLN
jgi:midasin